MGDVTAEKMQLDGVSRSSGREAEEQSRGDVGNCNGFKCADGAVLWALLESLETVRQPCGRGKRSRRLARDTFQLPRNVPLHIRHPGIEAANFLATRYTQRATTTEPMVQFSVYLCSL